MTEIIGEKDCQKVDGAVVLANLALSHTEKRRRAKPSAVRDIGD